MGCIILVGILYGVYEAISDARAHSKQLHLSLSDPMSEKLGKGIGREGSDTSSNPLAVSKCDWWCPLPIMAAGSASLVEQLLPGQSNARVLYRF